MTSKCYFGHHQLEYADEYKYLGVVLHFGGSFKRAKSVLYKKALRAYHALTADLTNIENIPIKALLKLFTATVVPIMLYGCEVWGGYSLGKIKSFDIFKLKFFKIVDDIEKLQLKFLKRILGVNSKSVNLGVYGETGRGPLIIQIAVSVVKFLLRLNEPEYASSLAGQAAMTCIRETRQPVAFASHVLKLCGYSTLNDIKIINLKPTNFGKRLKERLNDEFSKYWYDQAELNKDGKLRTLYKIKRKLCFEHYLDKVINVNSRQAVTRLRLSSHRLPVELGRYYKTPLQQRTCHFCQAGVGEEFNYLLDCESLELKSLREKFIEKLIDVNQSFAMFAKTELSHYLRMAIQSFLLQQAIVKIFYPYMTSRQKLWNNVILN